MGRLWVAEGNRIYSFVHNKEASDNESVYKNLWLYKFADNGGELQSLYRSNGARWETGRIVFVGNVRKSTLLNGRVENSIQLGGELPTSVDPFKEVRRTPTQVSIAEAGQRIELSESDVERTVFEVALERKWSTIVVPFVIALFTAPFALSLNRKGKAATVGYAVGLLLVFMAVTSIFEQFGLNGSLQPWVAVWSPLGLFAMLGVYLLSRVKT